MPVRNRKTSSREPKGTNLASRYGKIGISALEAASRYGWSRDVKEPLNPTRAPGKRRASEERRKQSKQ
jgi:hypothetical protein